MTKFFVPICLLSIGVLFFAFFKQPYWYYQCVHWIICGTALMGVWYANESQKVAFAWMFVAITIVFNPIAPLYFHRNLWQIIDLVAAVIFAAAILSVRKPSLK